MAIMPGFLVCYVAVYSDWLYSLIFMMAFWLHILAHCLAMLNILAILYMLAEYPACLSWLC
jgi:hypothetical protein